MYVNYNLINLIENLQRKMWFGVLSQEPYCFLKFPRKAFLITRILFINVRFWCSARSMGQWGKGFPETLIPVSVLSLLVVWHWVNHLSSFTFLSQKSLARAARTNQFPLLLLFFNLSINLVQPKPFRHFPQPPASYPGKRGQILSAERDVWFYSQCIHQEPCFLSTMVPVSWSLPPPPSHQGDHIS